MTAKLFSARKQKYFGGFLPLVRKLTLPEYQENIQDVLRSGHKDKPLLRRGRCSHWYLRMNACVANCWRTLQNTTSQTNVSSSTARAQPSVNGTNIWGTLHGGLRIHTAHDKRKSYKHPHNKQPAFRYDRTQDCRLVAAYTCTGESNKPAVTA